MIDDNMKEICCDVLGKELKAGKKFLTNRTASGEEWIPAFVQKVDAEKCIGCGSCVKVCLGKCYELREANVNGKKKKVAVVIRPDNCFGDCHCHKVCPVKIEGENRWTHTKYASFGLPSSGSGGAMVCKPKEIR